MAGFGPLGPRAVNARPTPDADTYDGASTWFRDCSAAGAADGTVPTASWFNHIIGNFRYAANRANVAALNDQSSAGDAYLWQIINGIIDNRLGTSRDGSWNLI